MPQTPLPLENPQVGRIKDQIATNLEALQSQQERYLTSLNSFWSGALAEAEAQEVAMQMP